MDSASGLLRLEKIYLKTQRLHNFDVGKSMNVDKTTREEGKIRRESRERAVEKKKKNERERERSCISIRGLFLFVGQDTGRLLCCCCSGYDDGRGKQEFEKTDIHSHRRRHPTERWRKKERARKEREHDGTFPRRNSSTVGVMSHSNNAR